jgi:phenylacetate-CoA ligase
MTDEHYWNEKNETMPRKELKDLQIQRLKKIVRFCFDNSAFYKKKFKETGLTPEKITTLDDIQKIPFTVKNDLRDNYPLGMLGVHPDEIVEMHASSGTTGNPIVGPYTASDMEIWQELMARTIFSAGVRKHDVIHIAYGYGLFTGGLGFHYGAQKVGAAIVPVGGGMTQRQIKLMKDLNVTALACTPSFAVYLAETMIKEGVNPRKDLKLKYGLFGAEPWSEKLRERIEHEFGIEATDCYGLTEMCGPGVAVECHRHNGLHISEDHFLIETIDPKTGDVLPEGEEGELVFTALTKTGMPILRYRTRDISVIETDKCECGRALARMMRIQGRSDDMLIIRGVNVFPSQIEYVVMGFPELATQYQILVDRPEALDSFAIKLELSEKTLQNPQFDIGLLKCRIQEKMHSVTGLSPAIELVKPGEIPRTDGKAKRVLDLRTGKI